MERIILIETSTALCSTAMVEDGKIVCYRESSENRAHASLTAVFVDEMLKERGCSLNECSAVCISEGPGSYTGLRVGVSTAKGLCFGAGIPLLSVGTLEILVNQALQKHVPEDSQRERDEDKLTFKYIVPMIDARRMEVYTAIFEGNGTRGHVPEVSFGKFTFSRFEHRRGLRASLDEMGVRVSERVCALRGSVSDEENRSLSEDVAETVAVDRDSTT